MWENTGADDGKGNGCDRLPGSFWLSGTSGMRSRQVPSLPYGVDGGGNVSGKGKCGALVARII